MNGLEGITRVGVLGLDDDGSVFPAVLLAEEGIQVVGAHLGPPGSIGLPEFTTQAFERVSDHVNLLDGTWGPTLRDGGWRRLAEGLEDVDLLLLGRWDGWLNDDVGAAVVEWAAATRTRMIVLEAHNLLIDTTVRRFAEWARQYDAEELVVFLREAAEADDTEPGWTPILADAHPLLHIFGDHDLAYTDLPTVQRQGAFMREELNIPLAGLQWAPTELIIAPGHRLILHAQKLILVDDDEEPGELFSVSFSGATTPLRVFVGTDRHGEIKALRVSPRVDPFTFEVQLRHTNLLDITAERLHVSDRGMQITEGGEEALQIPPGTYVLERDVLSTMAQLYWIPDARLAEPMYEDCCHICRASFPKVVYGMPSVDAAEAAARGEIILGGCIPPTSALASGLSESCRRCGTWLDIGSEGRQVRRPWRPSPWMLT